MASVSVHNSDQEPSATDVKGTAHPCHGDVHPPDSTIFEELGLSTATFESADMVAPLATDVKGTVHPCHGNVHPPDSTVFEELAVYYAETPN
jgi:hypothetical protein